MCSTSPRGRPQAPATNTVAPSGTSPRAASAVRVGGTHAIILDAKRPGEAQLVPVWVPDVEKAFAPRRVHRRAGGGHPRRTRPLVHGVHVVDPEHDAPPYAVGGRTALVKLQV